MLEFLAVDGDASERELEQRMVDRILDTMRELGPGLAFVGRQMHFDIDGDDFNVDLLFFHVEQLRYVVIELKVTKFDPAPSSSGSTSPSSMTASGSATITSRPSASWSSPTSATPSSGMPSPASTSRWQ